MWLISWTGALVALLWSHLLPLMGSASGSLLATMVLVWTARFLLSKILNRWMRARLEALQRVLGPLTTIDEEHADDPELRRAKRHAFLIESGGGLTLMLGPVTKLAFVGGQLVVNAFAMLAFLLLFWRPELYQSYGAVAGLSGEAGGAASLSIVGLDVFGRLAGELGRDPVRWGVFVLTEAILAGIANRRASGGLSLKPGLGQGVAVVLLFLPAGLWVLRVVLFSLGSLAGLVQRDSATAPDPDSVGIP